MKQPAVMQTAGCLARDNVWRPAWTRYLPGSLMKLRSTGASRDDFGRDLAETVNAERAGRGGGQVEHPAAHERPAVVDGDDDAAAAMAHPELGAEGQRAVRAGHGVFVETLTGSGLAAGFIAVEGGDARKAMSGPRRRHGIGAAQSRLCAVVGDRAMARMGVVAVMMMVPGLGRGLGGGATDQESCGDRKDRRARAGYPRRRLLQCLH